VVVFVTLSHCVHLYSPLPSLEEQEKHLEAAKSLKDKFEGANLQLVTNVVEFNSPNLDSNDGTDSAEEFENRDPAIVAADVAAQTVCLRESGMPMH
jgi:hypothetical protein